MTGKCVWSLGNGHTLEFSIYANNDGWNEVPGLYIFAFQTPRGWLALYVGQADTFQTRLPHHERLAEAVRRGATHIHALVVHERSTRDALERMLIGHLQPPMNAQLRSPIRV